MENLKKVQASIGAYTSMKGLVEVYEQVAANNMKDIRTAILGSRDYYQGLAMLSAEVGEDLSGMPKSVQRTALVLLSANSGMYGEIVENVFVQFMQSVKEQNLKSCDLFVAGSAGQELMAQFALDISYTALPLHNPTLDLPTTLAMITKELSRYRTVKIFYGQFHNIARQDPNERTVTSQRIEAVKQSWAGELPVKLKYLYEPSAVAISEVFAAEIFDGIFAQTYQESELAKHAARLWHLDLAMSKIDTQLESAKRGYTTRTKQLRGKKLQIQLAGYHAKHSRRMYATS